MHLSVGISLTYPGSASLSGAGAFLADYSSDGQGYAHYFSGATPSVKIVDSGTPANDIDTSLASFDAYNNVLTYTSPSVKNVMQADGYVKYSAHNLFESSETFATDWAWSGAAISAAVVSLPSGYTEAVKFTESVGSSVHRVYIAPGIVVGHPFRAAVIAKADTRQWLQVMTNGTGSNQSFNFDLTNGVIGSGGSHAGLTRNMTPLDDGWYLCEIEIPNPIAAGSVYLLLQDGDNASGATYTGDGSSGLFLSGAHGHQLPADRTYLKTGADPRYALPIEYDTSGEAIGVLVEPAATNLLAYSSEQSNWTKSDITVTSNTTPGPSGATDADTCEVTSTGSFQYCYLSPSLTLNETYTYSHEFKYNNSQFIWMLCEVGADSFAWFDIQNGTVETVNAGVTATITPLDLTGEWYRCQVTFTKTTATALEAVGWGLADSDGSSTATIGQSLYVGRGQLETGTVATSPIATAGSTVTRLADDLTIATSAFPHSATEGTYFAEYVAPGHSSMVMNIDDGTANEKFFLYANNAGQRAQFSVFDGGALQADISNGGLSAFTIGDTVKAVGAYKLNDFASTYDGGAVSTDVVGTVPTVTTIRVGYRLTGIQNIASHIKSIAYIPERITDANLVVMTT